MDTQRSEAAPSTKSDAAVALDRETVKLQCPACLKSFVVESAEPELTCPNCGAVQTPQQTEADADAAPSGLSATRPAADSTCDELEPDAAEGAAGDGARLSGRQNKDFGSYEIIEEINRGSMGIVYRARDKKLGRIVALKVLLAGEHASPQQISRFQREAQAIGKLHHPNIVPIHEIGEYNGQHYFTMDFIDGVSLSRLLKRKKIDPARCLDIIEAVCDAVQAAHEAGVIHRDIKPSNIMIDYRGRVQIMDFGLAKQLDRESNYTQSGTTIGTPAYMPPEQARGHLRRIGRASDVYSIGAVLYEMVTGRAPFSGSNMLEVILRVIREEPPPPRQLNAKVNRDIQTIILKAMEKDLERRYATARELAEDIRRFRAGEAIRARPIGLLGRLWRKARVHKAVAASVLTVLLVVGVSAGIIYALWRQLQRRPMAGVVAKPDEEIAEDRWKEVFASDPSDPDRVKADWIARPRRYLDYRDGRLRAILEGWEYVIKQEDPFYGNVRMSFSAAPAAGAREPVISCALVGHDEKASILCTFGQGKIVIAGREDISEFDSRRPLQRVIVLAERDAAPLKPGGKYRVTFERHNMDVRFRVQGDGLDETITYRNLHFSNWRVKNVDLILRAVPDSVTYSSVRVEQLFPGRTGPLQSADDRFYRGDYNGAKRTYEDCIKAPFAPGIRIQAYHRLGLYHEIKNRHAIALRHYGTARDLYEQARGEQEKSQAPRMSSATLEALAPIVAECQLRSLFCLSALKDYDAYRERAAAYGDTGLPSTPWSWHYPQLARDLLAAGRLNDALHIYRLSPRPSGSRRVEIAAMRLGRELAKKKRYDDLKTLYAWMPTPLLGPVFADAGAAAGKAGNVDAAIDLLSFAKPRFPDDRTHFLAVAVRLAEDCVKRKTFARVLELHRLMPHDRLADRLAGAVAGAVRSNQAEDAFLLLAYAREHIDRRRDDLVSFSLDLGNRLVESNRERDVIRLYKAYPSKALDRVFRQAMQRLAQSDADAAFELYLFARERLGADTSERLRAQGLALMEAAANKNNNDENENARARITKLKHLTQL